MTELQAALGTTQIKRLNNYVARRHELAGRYNKLLQNLPITTPWQHPDSYSGFHLYVIRLNTDALNISQKSCFEKLRESGIGVNLHYIPVHLQPYYSQLGFKHGDFPKAEHYYTQAISLPLYPNLSETNQDRVVAALKKILEE